MKKTRPVRWGLLLAALMLGVLQASALHGSDHYPFNTRLTVNATGNGTVYMNYNALNQDNSGQATSSTKVFPATITSSTNSTSITLNATPASGFRFLRWTNDNTGEVVSSTSTSPTTSLTYNTSASGVSARRVTDAWFIITLLWHNEYSPAQTFGFTAHFKENGSVIAKVQDGQESVGSAVIREEHFDVGDEVHLVASNINMSEMNGWSFDHWEVDGVNISDKPEITVTVTDEVVTYVAVFSQANTENYCFLRNKATGRYLKLVKKANYTSNGDAQNPVGSFNGAFEMCDEATAISDPGCVFTVSGTSDGGMLKNAWITSQSTTVGHFSTATVTTKSLNIKPMNDGTYSISFIHTESRVDIDVYFRDNNGTPDLSPINDARTEWEIRVLNSANIDKWYFGAAPNQLLKRGDKYYTTLYTTFPYRVLDGKAYYINHESLMAFGEGDDVSYKVKCFEIESGIVPPNTPVILECDGYTAAENKLQPLPVQSDMWALEGSLMRGNIEIVDGAKAGDGNIYVLSVGKNTGLGFYKLKAGTKIPDNKCYAVLSDEAQAKISSVSYVFDDEEPEGEATSLDEVVTLPEDLTGLPIYDLQGRRVSNPQHGVYIVNGKKFVIK